MARIRADYVFGTVEDTGGLTDVATSLTSAGLSRLPAVSGGDVAAITLYDSASSAFEIVHVTAHTASATTATILRGREGTTAQAWAEGADWLHGLTVADTSDLNGASILDDLTDVDVTTTAPANGDRLVYNSTSSVWEPAPPPTGTVEALGDLADVDLATVAPTSGDVLTFDGTTWEPTAPTTGGGGGGTTPTEYDPTVERAAGLQSWHRCDAGLTVSGSDVTAWADKRGTGPSFTLPGSTTAPKTVAAKMGGASGSSVTALGFDGSGRLASSSFTPASGASARTIMMVVLACWAQGGTNGAFRHLLHYGSQNANQAYGIVMYDGSLGNHYWSNGMTSWFPGWASMASVYAARYDGTKDQQFRNGMPGPPKTISLGTGTSDGTLLGSRLLPQAEGASFVLAELITWNEALTDTEIKTAAQKLLSWWTQP